MPLFGPASASKSAKVLAEEQPDTVLQNFEENLFTLQGR